MRRTRELTMLSAIFTTLSTWDLRKVGTENTSFRLRSRSESGQLFKKLTCTHDSHTLENFPHGGQCFCYYCFKLGAHIKDCSLLKRDQDAQWSGDGASRDATEKARPQLAEDTRKCRLEKLDRRQGGRTDIVFELDPEAEDSVLVDLAELDENMLQFAITKDDTKLIQESSLSHPF